MTTDIFSLQGKTAIVTGASSGLGVRFARTLHGAGANVVIAARRLDRLKELSNELTGSLAVQCDVVNDDDLDQLVDATLTAFGQIDVLVNNAGIGSPVPAEMEPLDYFREVVAVNLTATFALSQKVGIRMIEAGRGTIVNNASILGLVASGQVPQASYTSSKGGVVQLTRELAVQWARKGVRVNALAPGWFESEMTAEMFQDEGALTWARRKTPMGRTGEAHELDGALLFLASEASSFMTGQVLCVDGGWTAV
ncbi:MAG: hypothetical protein QOJ00_1014 [Actinomycetota bacterium]